MNHFNHMANEWDSDDKIKMMKTLAAKAKEILQLEGKYTILDFGCGTGLFGLEFTDFAKHLLGIDTSEGMLKIWDQKTLEQKNITRKKINLEDEELDEKFDLILSSMAFHHLNNPSIMIQKLDHMLTPQGKIAIIDLEKEDGTFHPDNKKMGVQHFGFSLEEIQKWGEENKLTIQTHRINTIHKNEKDYHQFLVILTKP